nr:reverse transcriptase domain-containing protein [Tanacetum cinerariifolium]
MRQILLPVKIGDAEHSTFTWMNFVVVRSPSPYDGIIGRPGVRKIQAVPSKNSRNAKILGTKRDTHSAEQQDNPTRIHDEYPEQTIAIGSTLIEEEWKALCDLLRSNLDIFAWKPTDMTGVSRHIAEHRLNVREGCLPVRQKKRSQAPERNKAIQEEVEKLVDTGIMKEVHYHSLLSNPLMVKKHDDSWRMCVDFKDLNKACPKDSYPLPEIDWKVESLCGCPFKGRHVLGLQDDPLDTPMEAKEELLDPWTLFTDGSFCIDSSGAGLIVTNLEGAKFTYALRFRFHATNNEAEYEALIAGLRITEQMGVKNLQTNVDSRLVANQVNGSYIAKEPGTIQYLEKVKTLSSSFKKISIKQVPTSENEKADALSKIASTSFAHLTKQALVEELNEKFINKAKVLAVVEEEGDTWMTPIQITSRKHNPFKDWSEKLCIRQRLVSVKHPQANGLVERANTSLGEGIKARLDERSKDWIEEIPHVLWAHRTMIKTSKIDMVQNDEALEINLDILEERREQAAIHETRSKAKMKKYYNSKLRNTSFKPGDLVYQNNDASHAKDSGKLSHK